MFFSSNIQLFGYKHGVGRWLGLAWVGILPGKCNRGREVQKGVHRGININDGLWKLSWVGGEKVMEAE